MLITALLIAQSAALVMLIARLLPGRKRRPPTAPSLDEIADTTVSVIVTTLNEAARIGPCLAGLRAQRRPLLEILVVDSRSTDGTRDIVDAVATLDPRIQLLTDEPLPAGWVGKVWALQHGLHAARGEWVLGIDADTEPMLGLVAGVIVAARASRYDVVSFSPKFAAQSGWEQFLQPALLRTLIYRTGAAGTNAAPDRVLANGQCFLSRREVLLRHGGYEPARASFADDVTLARYLARLGVRVGFLDGSRLYRVRSYRSAAEMWREWGRSLDLSDATGAARQWLDIAFLIAAQGLPLVVLATLASIAWTTPLSVAARSLAVVNGVLVLIPLLLLRALSSSYERTALPFWLSWLADPLAVARIIISTVRRPRTWRGRRY